MSLAQPNTSLGYPKEIPTMLEWEAALAVRDGVFAQIFLLTVLGYETFKVFIFPRLKRLTLSVVFILFVILYVGTVANIVLWQP